MHNINIPSKTSIALNFSSSFNKSELNGQTGTWLKITNDEC